MQIALEMKHRATGYGRALYVRGIDWKAARPVIRLQPEPTEAEDSATVDGLDVILAEIVAQSASLIGYRIVARDFAHVVEA